MSKKVPRSPVDKIQRIYAYLLRRSFGTNRPLVQCNKEFEKFKLKQARMKCDDGLPVYLKAGMRDKVLFNITRGWVLFCMMLSLYTAKQFICKTSYVTPRRS